MCVKVGGLVGENISLSRSLEQAATNNQFTPDNQQNRYIQQIQQQYWYSVSTNFRLEPIEPTAREVFIFCSLVGEKSGGRVLRGEKNMAQS